jgi:lysine biosynthesis protein LysW
MVMATTQCVSCDEEIEVVGRVRLGQKITCDFCGSALEVVSTSPLEVELAQDEDEDWDDDDELLDDDELDDLEDDLEDEGELDDDFEEDDLEDDDFVYDDEDEEDDKRW